MNTLSRYSLDAPIVAVVWLGLFEKFTSVTLESHHYIILFLATWLAYCADRIFDGFRIADKQASDRHLFYAEHSKPLSILWVITLVVTLIISFSTLSASTLFSGFLLTAMIALYFSFIHLYPGRKVVHLHKECSVALIFSLGVTLFIWMNNPAEALEMAFMQAIFTFICLINLLFISAWDAEMDARQQTIAIYANRRLYRNLFTVSIMIAVAGIILGIIFLQAYMLVLSFALSLSILLLLAKMTKLSNETKRSLADMSLMLPVIFLF